MNYILLTALGILVVWLISLRINYELIYDRDGALEGLEPAWMRLPLFLSGPILLVYITFGGLKFPLCDKCNKQLNLCKCKSSRINPGEL